MQSVTIFLCLIPLAFMELKYWRKNSEVQDFSLQLKKAPEPEGTELHFQDELIPKSNNSFLVCYFDKQPK